MKKLLTVFCLLAMLLGMIAVPAVTAEAASTETFYAGYGIANVTPKYTVKSVKVSTSSDWAELGVSSGSISLKVITDPIIFASYGTSESRMGQNYIASNSYDADGNLISATQYFTKVNASGNASYNGTRPAYQIVDGDLFVTCIALRNGESGEPLLLVAIDMSGASEDVTKQIRQSIKEAIPNIDTSRIMVSASHTHSAPSIASTDENTAKWAQEVFYPGVVQAAQNALDDLAKADIQTTTVCATDADKVGGEYFISEDENGHINNSDRIVTSVANFNYDKSKGNVDTRLQYMSAVRHYKYQVYACMTCGQSYVRTDDENDNKWSYSYEAAYQKKEGDPCSDENCKGKVTLVTRYYGDSFWTRAEGICAPTTMVVNVKQAYQDMHIVKFDRTESGKKPIVLLNWRAHPHRTGSEDSSIMSNDLSGAIRDVLCGLRKSDGTYAIDPTGTDITRNMSYLVSYYQGAAGNINETSHDRVNNSSNSWANTVGLNKEEKSYYYDRKTGEATGLYTQNYFNQGAILADIAYDALNTPKWWTNAAEGEIDVICSTYTSDTTDLSIQISQMGGMAAHRDKNELQKYQYLYNKTVEMRNLWAQRNDRSKYKDIQACRRAIISLDQSHVINGIYHANKIYGLLSPYAKDGVFNASSLETYKADLSAKSEEISTIRIGSDLAIVTAPHELFDLTGQQIEMLGKDLGMNNLKVLNFCYSNGSNGYIPYESAWLYTSDIAENDDYDYYFSASPYEANTCSYKIGTAEGIVEAARTMLIQLTQNTSAGHTHCACEGNNTGYYHNTGHVCKRELWDYVADHITDGKMTLTDGMKVVLNNNATTLTSITVESGSAMLCLNGFTLTMTDAITVKSGATLAICDCNASKKGLGIIKNTTTSSNVITVDSGGELLLYGGTLDGHYNSANGKHRVIISNGRVYMFGGTVTNGQTSVVSSGANVSIQSGQFWLYGGTIQNGNTNINATQAQKSGTSSIHGVGGNVYLGEGLFCQYGGTISGGTAALSGGNVFMAGGEYDMYGGTVTGGVATPDGTKVGYARNTAGAGGNLYVYAGTFTQRGGVISDGTAARSGGNIYARGAVNLHEFQRLDATETKARVTGGTVTGVQLTGTENAATAGYTPTTGANGGNIYISNATLWMYGGEVSGGKVGLDSNGVKTLASGTASGGNIYATSTVRIGGEVSGGAAITRGNNVYVDSNMVVNLEGAHITDTATFANKAAENVNIHDSKTVKLVGDCQIIGGKYAIRILNTAAELPAEITSETPETGVWLDSITDEATGEIFAPVFGGEEADIVLDTNTYLCLYDGFQDAVSNYYYKNGTDKDGNPLNVDNRIVVKMDGETSEPYQFARKAITYTAVKKETTDTQGQPTTITEYVFKPSVVRLGDMRYCFKGADEDKSVSLVYDAELGATTPTNPEEAKKQWLVLTAYVADVGGKHYTLADALAEFAKGTGDQITLLCAASADETLTYAGTRTLVIDLDGHDLVADFTMTNGAKLACIDSTTNDYNCYWEGNEKIKYGILHTNSADVMEPQYLHGSRRYLRMDETANSAGAPGYSFHRIYMNMTAFGITPAKTGITYSAAFLSNARVRNVLGKSNYGIMATTWYDTNGNGVMDADEKISDTFLTYEKYISTPIKDWTDPSNDPSVFDQTELASGQIYKKTFIEGFLEESSDPDIPWTSEQRANIKLDLVPTVLIGEEYIAVGAKVTRTYQEQIGKANAAWTAGTLTDTQKDALYSMYRQYMDTMSLWEDKYVSNMRDRYHDESSVDKPLDNEQDGDPWA